VACSVPHPRRRRPFIQNRPCSEALVPFFNLPLQLLVRKAVRGDFRICIRMAAAARPSNGLCLQVFPPLYSFRWYHTVSRFPRVSDSSRRSSQLLSSHASGRARPSSSSSRTPSRHLRQHRLGPGSTASPGLPPRCASAYSAREFFAHI
jgi:hypothetical protein